MLTKLSHVVFEKEYDIILQRTSNAVTIGSLVNIYIVCKTASKSIISTNTLTNSLYGATKVTNTSTKDPQKYNYTGWGIAFSSNTFKHPHTGGTGKNVIIFGVNTENSEKENNKKQSIMVLSYGSVKTNDTDIYAEKSYTPDFTSDNKITCLSLHYNGDNSFLFVNGKQITQFKANAGINKYPIAIGNIADRADLPDSDIKVNKFYGNIYDFSVSYEQISKENILKSPTYLMKKMLLYK